MNTEITTALIGLIGISLGALLGGAGYYLKFRMEMLRNKKIVLFHLLEFRHQVVISYINPKDFTTEYLDICKSYFKKTGFIGEEDFPDNMRVPIEGFVTNLIAARSPNIDHEFIRSYEDSLKNLCSTDPILAFKLRGMERLYEIIDIKEKYIADFNESLDVNTPLQVHDFLGREVRRVGDDAVGELLKDIGKDISTVAWSCGFLTWFCCRKIIREKPTSSKNFNRMEIEEVLEKLFEKLLAEMKSPAH